jgi:hypothetical protein
MELAHSQKKLLAQLLESDVSTISLSIHDKIEMIRSLIRRLAKNLPKKTLDSISDYGPANFA